MIDWSWISTSGVAVVMVMLTALGLYVSLLLFTRLAGLRSFSKISSFDFAVTVAIGSVLATTLLSENPPLLQGILGLAVLYGLQLGVAALRRRSRWVGRLVDNQPLLLMAGDEVLDDHLDRAHITREDLWAKLREANVIHPSQVRAVVLESTGDVSVLHAGADQPELDLDLLSGVRGVERLKSC